MPDYILYQTRVTVLSPLHIGSGRDLLNEYDYAIHQGQTWRINEDALLEAQDVDDPALADRLAETPPAQLLNRPADFRPDSSFFRYVIKGTPRATGPGAQVREQLKDVYDRPYLPGTSLKGALRTAIAWVAWEKLGLRPERAHLDRSRQFAARWYEQEIFSEHSSRAPNKDTLRALQVGDSTPVGVDRLMIVNVRVLNRGGALGSPIEVEALRPDTILELPIKLDLALFSEWAKAKDLDLHGETVLRDLPAAVQRYSSTRMAKEADWLGRISGADRVAAFYREIGKARFGSAAFVMQLGWGTGWEAKTLGSHLQADPHFMEGLIDDYRLARGKRKPGDPFPKSRRVLVQVQRSPDGRIVETPRLPLGWVLVEMKGEAKYDPLDRT